MSEPSQYDEIWAAKTDEELFQALAHAGDYAPAAIEAVQREIARRHLDVQQISELESAAAKTKAEETAKAELPLRWPMRILMFLLSFGIAQIILMEYYGSRGYTRRSREVWRWMAYGLLFWLALAVLIRVAITLRIPSCLVFPPV